MIVKADITYTDGTVVTFTGEPVDLSSLPLLSPDEQAAAEAPVEAPVEPAPTDAPSEPAPVEETPVEAAPVDAPVDATPAVEPTEVHVTDGEVVEIVVDAQA